MVASVLKAKRFLMSGLSVKELMSSKVVAVSVYVEDFDAATYVGDEVANEGLGVVQVVPFARPLLLGGVEEDTLDDLGILVVDKAEAEGEFALLLQESIGVYKAASNPYALQPGQEAAVVQPFILYHLRDTQCELNSVALAKDEEWIGTSTRLGYNLMNNGVIIKIIRFNCKYLLIR
jgi:hypothetical protein